MATQYLKTDKFPYLLTIGFSLIGWGVTRIVDRLSKAPLIEYYVDQSEDNEQYKAIYTIENIATDQSFDSVTFFLIKTDKNDSIRKGTFYIPPPMKADSMDEVGEDYPNSYSLTLNKLQPQTKILINLLKKNDTLIPLRIESSSTVILSRPTVGTFLVKHEVSIIFTLIIFWIVIIIIYITRIKIT